MSTLRRVSSWLHLYGGLALGGLLIVISVSGSVLVFKDALDRWLRPDLLQVEPSERQMSLTQVITTVRETHPNARLRLVEMPARADAPITVWLTEDNTQVYVDPYRETILGSRGPEEGLMNTISALHIDLLAGRSGGRIVGVTGLLLVILTATGLVLWWPRRLRALWTALRITWQHGTLRFNYDLHRAGGFYATIFLLLTALTGSAFIFYPTTQQIISTVTASEPWPPPPPTVEAPADSSRNPARYDVQSARATALERLPGSKASFIYLPQQPTEPLTVRLRTPPEWHPNGRSFVYLHPTEQSVLRVDDARNAPGGAQVLQTFYPLHIGAVGGLLVKWLYVLFGLAPAVLSVTGTIIWFQRWRRTTSSSQGTLNEHDDATGTRPVELPARPTRENATQAVTPPVPEER